MRTIPNTCREAWGCHPSMHFKGQHKVQVPEYILGDGNLGKVWSFDLLQGILLNSTADGPFSLQYYRILAHSWSGRIEPQPSLHLVKEVDLDFQFGANDCLADWLKCAVLVTLWQLLVIIFHLDLRINSLYVCLSVRCVQNSWRRVVRDVTGKTVKRCDDYCLYPRPLLNGDPPN